MTRKKITGEQRKDWRNLPYEDWNVRTVHAYFEDMNRERFGVDEYLPMRNWRFEQGVIKRALDEHGAKVLHRAFDECFRTYRPTREFPLLTAGFAVSYRINGLIPRIKAELAADEREREVVAGIADEANRKGWEAWL